MSKKSIQDILTTLNEKQLEAVEAIYWPVLVIAWPGSGKTQLLSARIANILETTDYLPSNILCLTFTDNAAKNMRDRLAGMIGHDAYRVAIHTFHSFWSEIINRYRYLSKEYNEAKPVDTIEASRILDIILEWLSWDNPYKPWFRSSETIKEVLSLIGNLKKWWLTGDVYKKILTHNQETIDILNPIIENVWEEIDALWQKKEEKERKIELFRKFTDRVLQMSVYEKHIDGYESFLSLFRRSLEESWELYEWDSSTKFMNAWRDEWTLKNPKWKRELKETSKLEKQIALADIFEAYQKELTERWLIDFSDMILEAIRLVETYDVVRMNLAEQYQFMMIDEFQDTNEAQMRLIGNILSVSNESPNIFAVGDDDQSIYKFQWANTKTIRDFHDNYADTKLIILEKNYRSKEEIISISRTVINQELNNIGNIFPWAKKQFEAVRGDAGIVRRKVFTNELYEFSWIVDDIAKKIESGVNPRDIAIIAKKNKTLETLAKWLLGKNISVSLSKDESIFETESVSLVLDILRILESLDDAYSAENTELLVKTLSHDAFGIQRLVLWNISKDIYHARKEKSRSWIESLSSHADTDIRNFWNFLKELSQRSRNERLENIIDYITGANTLSIPDDYDDVWEKDPLQIEIFWEKRDYSSPLFNYFFGQLWNNNWLNINYARHLANIRAFIESVRSYKNGKEFLSLGDAIKLLELIKKYDITISASHVIGDEKNSINLITVHKAKWLEWEHVYVPCLTNTEYKMGKIWGSPLPKNLPLEAERDNDEDIERLVYTGFTRAKDTLTISYSKENIDEKTLEPLSCIHAESWEWAEQIMTWEVSDILSTLEIEKKELFSLPYLWEERDFLRDRIEKLFVMNATALQSFLNIADAGPEYFVSHSLLRFPQAKNISASYGSAMHKALEDFLSDYTQKWTFMKSLLFESFEETLKKEGFDKKTEADYLERGRANLESLYTEITRQTYGELRMEEDFRTASWGTWLGDIQLTGKIDRIEKLPDDSLIITDYKTGRGFDAFDGRWAEHEKIKQWKYRLQLCFYAILFELSPRWRMFQNKKYELFFVEKNRDEERFHRVIEYIQEWEIERTKKLIIATMNHIRNLDFPDISKYPQTVEGIRMFEEDLLSWQI
jgi:DNA helicase II / ATP-dependent DNA helicase PcrA